VAKALGAGFQFLVKHIGLLNTALLGLLIAVGIFGAASVTAALSSAAAWLLAVAPVALLFALLGFIVLLIEDIYVGMKGGESVVFSLFDAWSDFIDKWVSNTDGDGWLLKSLKVVLYFLMHMGEAWDDAVEYWQSVVEGFSQWILDLFNGIWDSIKKGASSVLDALNPFSGGESSFEQTIKNAAGQTALFPAINLPTGKTVNANTHVGSITVNAPGSDPTAVAGAVRKTLDEFHATKLREAHAAVQ
jgi:hypothetical protein